MILGLGTELRAVRGVPSQDRLQDLFTAGEIAYCRRMRYPGPHFAARHAAKIAALKALRLETGPWHEMETVRSENGSPTLLLTGSLSRIAIRLGVARVFLSLSHTRGHAAALVVLES